MHAVEDMRPDDEDGVKHPIGEFERVSEPRGNRESYENGALITYSVNRTDYSKQYSKIIS
jgi:hypothetical protein